MTDKWKQHPETLQLCLAVHRFLFAGLHTIEQLNEVVDSVSSYIRETGYDNLDGIIKAENNIKKGQLQ